MFGVLSYGELGVNIFHAIALHDSAPYTGYLIFTLCYSVPQFISVTNSYHKTRT